MIFKPFAAYRPPSDLASKVISHPYDVIDSDEARALAEGNPYSILHVNKPEIDLPVETHLYSDEVYAKGRENLEKFISEGYLQKDPQSCYYIYSQQLGDHVQYGVVGVTSVHEYGSGKIKIHENTRQAKEDDRTRMINEQNANVGPVFLTYPAQESIDNVVNELIKKVPDMDAVGPDGTLHKAWVVSDAELMVQLESLFAEIPAFYIADGHHRAASSARVGKMRYDAAIAAGETVTGNEPFNYFLSVVFPHNQLKVIDYNRVVKDLNGLSANEFMEAVKQSFTLSEGQNDEIRPPSRHQFSLFIEGQWYLMTLKPEVEATLPKDDPVANLDTQILTDLVLNPILNIGDLRKSDRIDFIGGTRGLKALSDRCSKDCAVAFALHPVSMEELMAVSDKGQLMPPKSTWFVPKLMSGCVIRLIE
ncbi:hypothetical protein RCL1_003086 [Eukaryota sp. TZLM3-RCL]